MEKPTGRLESGTTLHSRYTVIGLIGAGGMGAVYLADDPTLGSFRLEPYAAALVKLVREQKPAVFFFGATTRGRDLSAAVAADLETGLAVRDQLGSRWPAVAPGRWPRGPSCAARSS